MFVSEGAFAHAPNPKLFSCIYGSQFAFTYTCRYTNGADLVGCPRKQVAETKTALKDKWNLDWRMHLRIHS